MKTYNQTSHSGDYREDEVSVSMTVLGGTYGGGSEVLIIQRRMSDVRVWEDNIAPTVETHTGGGARHIDP